MALPIDHFTGQVDFILAGPLVKIALDGGFKPAWPLINHSPDRGDLLKIQAIGPDPVDPDIANHQHAEISFSFSLCTHQPCEKPYILFGIRNNGHNFTSLSSYSKAVSESIRIKPNSLFHKYVGNAVLCLMGKRKAPGAGQKEKRRGLAIGNCIDRKIGIRNACNVMNYFLMKKAPARAEA
jgi:hypothetical protein